MKMRNPLVLLVRVTDGDCRGHHIGLTWDGRLVFPNHEHGARGLRAELVTRRLRGIPLSNMTCGHLLEIKPGHYRVSEKYREMPPIDRRDAGRELVFSMLVNDSPRGLRGFSANLPFFSALKQIGLVEVVPVSLWDLIRR